MNAVRYNASHVAWPRWKRPRWRGVPVARERRWLVHNSHTIPATVSLDADALASLTPATSPAIAQLLADVRTLLASVLDRLASTDAMLVDRAEAARRLGVSARTLSGLPIPSVVIGGSRRWAVTDLVAFIDAARTAGSEPVRAMPQSLKTERVRISGNEGVAA